MAPKKFEDRQLQAVVLCDSYEPRFYPLTKNQPRCLLPLANTPLLEYTLEFLVSAQVSEVFLLCCSHADKVAEYISNTRWKSSSGPFKLTTIEMPNTSSIGDAMRDMDARGVLKGDFLLISGDVVSTLDFDKVWEAHQKRRQKDKNCIMSVVLRKSAPTHRTRSPQTGLYILQEETNRIVSYRHSVLDKSISLDTAELLAHPAVSFRNDLIDCHIDICTIDVPALFQENFDYEYLRKDFVNGILQSDLLGKTIYAEIVESDYAARVESFKTYDAVAKDIISRYAYPLVVDSNEGVVDQTYTYAKGHIYKEKDVVLSQTCKIGRGTVLGGKSFLGANTAVSASTVGRGCKIGSNVTITGSYIWENVTIEDDVVIEQSIIASGAIIRKGARLEPGAIISYGFEVPAGTTVTRNSHNFETTETDEEDDSDESDSANLHFLTSTLDQLDMSDDSISSVRNLAKRPKKTNRSLSANSAVSAFTEDEEEEEDFFKEAVASINRSIVDKHEQDVAILELNTLRMTMNASHDKVQAAAVHALISHIGHLVTQSDLKAATVSVFTTWSPLLRRITFDKEGEVLLATFTEDECVRRSDGDRLLFFALTTLYDTDVISEEAVYSWWKQPPASSKVRDQVSRWVEWLQTAEEESDSESD